LPDSKILSFASPKESIQRKGDPGLPPTAWVPSFRSKRAGLRNSHDPLRGHVLKQCSPNPTARLLLNEAALKGKKVKGGFVCASRTFSLVLARRPLPASRVLVLGFCIFIPCASAE